MKKVRAGMPLKMLLVANLWKDVPHMYFILSKAFTGK